MFVITSRVRCRITYTCPGVYMGFIRQIKSHEKIQRHITNTDKIQQNTRILHCPHSHLFTNHSFVHSFIHMTHHIINASPKHALHHLNASCHASPIHHTAAQHIIALKHYIQQITLTHNALNASQRRCIITIMHHSDDASQQSITALMHYGTTSL